MYPNLKPKSETSATFGPSIWDWDVIPVAENAGPGKLPENSRDRYRLHRADLSKTGLRHLLEYMELSMPPVDGVPPVQST